MIFVPQHEPGGVWPTEERSAIIDPFGTTLGPIDNGGLLAIRSVH